MTSIRTEELLSLRDGAAPPCASLYLPTRRGAPSARENQIRLKDLLRVADDRLTRSGIERAARESVLDPGRELLHDAGFWRHTEEGLALFLSGGERRHFWLSQVPPELAVAGGRFHLAPLLPLAGSDDRFHVLAISQKQARLFEVARDTASEVPLRGIPTSVAAALHTDSSEHALQLHGNAGSPQHAAAQAAAQGRGLPGARSGGRRQGMFHGHGTVIDDAKEQVHRFLQLLDDGLEGLLRHESPRRPLVLAGVAWELAIFRQVSAHPRLVEAAIEGNADGLSGAELGRRAWQLAEPLLRAGERQAAAALHDRLGTNLASNELEEVVRAAIDGRVEVLFFDPAAHRWGQFHNEARTVEIHPEWQPGDEDLLDRAACETAFRGGSVFGRAEESPLAALFRY